MVSRYWGAADYEVCRIKGQLAEINCRQLIYSKRESNNIVVFVKETLVQACQARAGFIEQETG